MWQKITTIAEGGSVLNIDTNRNGQTWAATGRGILQFSEGAWKAIPQARPFPFVSALISGGNAWWAAGLGGGLARSWDGGKSWSPCWLDQISEPITCLSASPRYRNDRTLLAGTDGAGILRSTDGGKRWLLSNFGLQDFTVLALAMASDWSRREYIFAGTLSGVYRSSGGGRAWKQSGLTDFVVQSLAAGLNFAENGLVLAGTEEDGLYRSTDGGQNWQQVDGDLGGAVSINALCSVSVDRAEIWLAGTDEGQLWRSADDGQTWNLVFETDESIQTIGAAADGILLAGLGDQGVLVSRDDGQSWQIDPSFSARNFLQVVPAADGQRFALAPIDGVWASADNGKTWNLAFDASFDQPVISMAATQNAVLAARADGLWRLADGQWGPIPASPQGCIAVAGSTASIAWAATPDSQLWYSADDGNTWKLGAAPFVGQQLLTLTTSPDGSPVVGIFISQAGMFNVWRLLDGQWTEWHRQSVTQPFAVAAAGGAQAEKTWLGVGRGMFGLIEQEWKQVAAFEATVRQIVLNASGEPVCVLAGDKIMHADSTGNWVELSTPEDNEQVIDLRVDDAGEITCLDAAAMLWRWAK